MAVNMHALGSVRDVPLAKHTELRCKCTRNLLHKSVGAVQVGQQTLTCHTFFITITKPKNTLVPMHYFKQLMTDVLLD